jgi:hypothetical protein
MLMTLPSCASWFDSKEKVNHFPAFGRLHLVEEETSAQQPCAGMKTDRVPVTIYFFFS